MIQVTNVKDYHGSLEEAAEYFSKAWGGGNNKPFYLDAMQNSYRGNNGGIPRFYIMLDNNQIIGCYALIINDFISRHDLYPWLAAVYISKSHRGQALASKLLAHGVKEAGHCGYDTVYLTTNHDGFYEKYGWIRIEDGYEPGGDLTRIYKISTNL